MGPIKLIQYSIDRGPVQFIRFYGPNGTGIKTEGEVRAFKELINLLGQEDTLFIGYNCSFDMWQMYRLYHIWLNQSFGAEGEQYVRPFKCKTLDLYLHCLLKGPFSAFSFASRKGDRATAVVRRVPKIAQAHVREAVLSKLKPLVPGDISVSEHEVKGKSDLITLSFNTSVKRLGLKAHAEHWGFPIIKLDDVWPLPDFEEHSWCPWWDQRYEEVERKCDKVLDDTEGLFYEYAKNDILYLYVVEDKLGSPQPDYNDTIAHIVAYTRYHGFGVNQATLEKTVTHYGNELTTLEAELQGIDLGSWQSKVKALKALNPIIQHANKTTLDAISKGTDKAAELARKMILYGPAKQKLDQARKVKEAIRLCCSLRVLGTATGRMAGEGSFNVQGIGKPEWLPNGDQIGLRASIEVSAVGDFHQFELCIGAAAWGITSMLADLTAGIDVHLKVANVCHPKLKRLGMTYEEALKAKKSSKHQHHKPVIECRKEAKNKIVFATFYGAQIPKIAEGLGITQDEAAVVQKTLFDMYPEMRAFVEQLKLLICTADTVTWARDSVSKMLDCETALTGFTRHWSFEKTVACIMWELGQSWASTGLRGIVVRQDAKGEQTIDNACKSAFLGSAIAVQQAVYRQLANMKIQTTGSDLCKMLGAELWDKFHIPMLCCHDEWVFARCNWFEYKPVAEHCLDFCDRKRGMVPHIRFDLSECKFWSEKE